MNEDEILEPKPAGRRLRRLTTTLLVVGALVFVASRIFYAVPGLNLLSERGRHDRRLTKLSDQMGFTIDAIRGDRTMDPANWPGADDRARYYLLAAMQKALWNVMLRPEDTVPGSLQAIHDRLDATEYEDLNSVKGCLEVFALFEEAAPRFRTYAPVLEIYGFQAEGMIPASKR